MSDTDISADSYYDESEESPAEHSEQDFEEVSTVCNEAYRSSQQACSSPSHGGYEIESFVDAERIEQDYDLLCSICYCVFRSPVKTHCGHTFCESCILRWMRVGSYCPKCKSPLSGNFSAKDRDQIVAAKTGELLIKCRNSDCAASVKLRELSTHHFRCLQTPALQWKDIQSVTEECLWDQLVPVTTECGESARRYIGRGRYKGDVLCGEFLRLTCCLLVTWDCYAHLLESFEALVNPWNLPIDWLQGAEGRVPTGALEGGQADGHESLYIGRAHSDTLGRIAGGKIHPSHRVLYIAERGREVSKEQYEVLCFAGIALSTSAFW